MVNRSEDLDVKAAGLKLSSGSESDGDNESEEETMVPVYGKGKSGAFNMLAQVRLFSSFVTRDISIQQRSGVRFLYLSPIVIFFFPGFLNLR